MTAARAKLYLFSHMGVEPLQNLGISKENYGILRIFFANSLDFYRNYCIIGNEVGKSGKKWEGGAGDADRRATLRHG